VLVCRIQQRIRIDVFVAGCLVSDLGLGSDGACSGGNLWIWRKQCLDYILLASRIEQVVLDLLGAYID
jgi:hypothetical protein